ncbi:hypothetical protein Acsp03_02970 [Actinomadura sp. NBRC 104412]|nr:hypothetical protein Acsp03_02970 [Actinomadura sp. NBRC 104412]
MSASPGWYPDPHWMGRERYWDGRAWTDRSRLWEGNRGPAPSAPPTPAQPAPTQPALARPAPVRPAPVQRAPRAVDAPPRASAARPPRSATPALTLLTALATEMAIVGPVAVALHLRWPVWGAAVPFLLWWTVALLPYRPRSKTPHREPDGKELARLADPWRHVLHRAGLDPRDHRVLLTDRDTLNACATTGHDIVVTERSARTLAPNQLEAVLAHELGHRSTASFTRLTWPSRLLWWTLSALWTPVGPMWRRAVAWHRPIGFLLVFLLAALATAVTVIAVVPAALTHALHRAARPLTDRTEFQADDFAVRLGLGPGLLAAIEHRLEATPADKPLPPRLLRRAERLRRRLA